MKKRYVLIILVFFTCIAFAERYRSEILFLTNDTQDIIEITTYPPLRFTGLAEKYITYKPDSLGKDTVWTWQFGAMNLQIIYPIHFWHGSGRTEINGETITKGIYLMQPNSSINLGQRTKPVKTFGVFGSDDIRIDSMTLLLNGKTKTLTREQIIESAKPIGKKKSGAFSLLTSTLL
jgi:hypothetical protein